ncbi:MAG TPA: YncE family protein [Verrucomicrobiae bacterium]|nr:YncE family protein [Verrucomicrobiae bacterium]
MSRFGRDMAPLPINAVLFVVVFLALGAGRGMAQLVISGNENKIDLTSGGPKVIRPGASDSISILDFAKFPPTVEHLLDVPNSVVGPPSNIAITRDRKVALIANSLKIDPANPTNWVPEDFVYVVDLAAKPPKVVGQVTTGRQPSGISIAPDGRFALVANRADGTVSILSLRGQEITVRKTVTVCLPAESPSDVAIAPDGKLALVSAWKGGYIAVLKIDGENITATGQKISTYGQPYRVVITPDGELALTAGMGFGNGLDRDAVTVIDLHSKPIRAIQHVTIGSVPESIEISPDGKLLAAVVMNGSNLAATDPNHSEHGGVLLLARKGKTFHVVEELPIGRIPEGVAFTPDGKYLVVQCHPDRELWIFSVNGGRLRDTGQRIKVPGMPSSLRASP